MVTDTLSHVAWRYLFEWARVLLSLFLLLVYVVLDIVIERLCIQFFLHLQCETIERVLVHVPKL
eukprot:COSAG06_NODE_25823_length_628_cov_0.737240_2_plen_63_part_01